MKALPIVASGLAVAALTACTGIPGLPGGKTSTAPSAPATSEPAATAPASTAPASTAPASTSAGSPSASSTPSAASSGGTSTTRTTPDGTVLKFGEPGVAVYESGNKKTGVQMKAVKIEKGTKEDLANFKIEDAALKQATPYYATMEYSYVDGEVLKYPYLNVKLKGADASGAQVQSVLLIGKFPKCDTQKPDSFGAGARYTECRVFMAPPGSELTQVAWAGDYKSKGLIWKK